MMRTLARAAVMIVVVGLALYTQLTHLASVPGLHFDEAWQGLFAHRIATEPGFHPLEAMNSYTTPLVHFILAVTFRSFGSSLLAMRGAYAAMNLSTLFLLALFLWRLGERRATAWFILLWALLPISVHDHRFYVEVTGFHGLCLALTLWGLALWKRAPVVSFALVVVAVVAGTYSHILFISVFGAGLFALARSYPAEFRSGRAQALIATLALLLAPLPVRMGLGLHKVLPFALAGALVATAVWALLTPRWIRFQSLWARWPRRAMRLSKVVFVLTLPFLAGFVALLWNGQWPYAQATGHLVAWWVPLNAAIFVAAAAIQLSRSSRRSVWGVAPLTGANPGRAPRARYPLSPSLVWGGFLATFLATSVLILKQTPRYYTVPLILAMIWCAQRLARLRSARLQLSIALAFAVWNLWAFQYEYLERFERAGSTTREFKIAFYHDNGRDFRPFQKMFDWASKSGCLAPKPWVEDDRFGRPFEFLRLSAPERPAGARCPWRPEDLFYSHIENYDPAFAGTRTDANTPPPGPAPNVKFLVHFPEWGDLAVWIQR